MAFSFEPLKGRMNWTALVDWSYRLWQFSYTPALIGAPTTPTGTPGDASQQIANDAFVQQELAANGITGSWISSFVPVVTAGSGTFTTVSATMRYKKIGKTVTFTAFITITTNGTAGTFIVMTLPLTALSGAATSFTGATLFSSTPTLCRVDPTALVLVNSTGGYPGGSGFLVTIAGTYEAV